MLYRLFQDGVWEEMDGRVATVLDILEEYREHDRIGRVRRLDFGGMGSKDGRRSQK